MGKKKNNGNDVTHMKLESGGLHLKKNSRNWYYRCTINGKTTDISTGTSDLDEAEKIAKGRFVPMTKATSEEILAAHVATAKRYSQQKQKQKLFLDNAWQTYSNDPGKATPATIDQQIAYKSTFDEFRSCVDNPKITIAEITHQHAVRFSEHLKEQHLSVDTHHENHQTERRGTGVRPRQDHRSSYKSVRHGAGMFPLTSRLPLLSIDVPVYGPFNEAEKKISLR